MKKRPQGILEATKALMGALVRMPPKQHDEMKVGKPRAKPTHKNRGVAALDEANFKAKRKKP